MPSPTASANLLPATRTLLRWAFWLDIVLMGFLVLVLVALFVGDPARLSITGRLELSPEERLRAARVIIGGVVAALALALPLLRQALAIVESARAGDPFVPENAARLRRMGWLLLAINVVVTTTVSWGLRGRVALPPVSVTSLLTVLMVFVIARIFEVGSRMRTELEGTI